MLSFEGTALTKHH